LSSGPNGVFLQGLWRLKAGAGRAMLATGGRRESEVTEERASTDRLRELLAILVCPKCRSKVAEKEGALRCANGACGLVYPIRSGVPVMLAEQAEYRAQATPAPFA
jgi:hypothetical protein